MLRENIRFPGGRVSSDQVLQPASGRGDNIDQKGSVLFFRRFQGGPPCGASMYSPLQVSGVSMNHPDRGSWNKEWCIDEATPPSTTLVPEKTQGLAPLVGR